MSQASNSTEVLQATKWILENIGWVQGQSAKFDGGKFVGFCLTGAVSTVACSVSSMCEAIDLLHQVVPKKFANLVSFNDNRKTTKKKVIKLIDKAIKKGTK